MIDITGADGEVARRMRVRAPDIEEISSRPAIAETDTADSETNQAPELGPKRVEIEKSNVLMM